MINQIFWHLNVPPYWQLPLGATASSDPPPPPRHYATDPVCIFHDRVWLFARYRASQSASSVAEFRCCCTSDWQLVSRYSAAANIRQLSTTADQQTIACQPYCELSLSPIHRNARTTQCQAWVLFDATDANDASKEVRKPVASCVRKVGEADSCIFLTDSCKFPTVDTLMLRSLILLLNFPKMWDF